MFSQQTQSVLDQSRSSTDNLQTFIRQSSNLHTTIFNMAAQNPETSVHFSFNETASSYPVLDIKHNNLYLNLDQVLSTSSKYFDSSFKSIFVCLKFSKISTALTLQCSVPIFVLSRAYATARYDKAQKRWFSTSQPINPLQSPNNTSTSYWIYHSTLTLSIQTTSPISIW